MKIFFHYGMYQGTDLEEKCNAIGALPERNL